jgi:hypothetical protein
MKYLFLLLVLVAITSQAATRAKRVSNHSTACQSITWTKPRDLPIKAFKEMLDKTPRREIVQLAWGEILNDSNKTVAAPVLQYLAGTESNDTLRGYYKAMNSMITRGLTPEEAILAWPKRVPARKPIYNLKQLCELYRKSGGL